MILESFPCYQIPENAINKCHCFGESTSEIGIISAEREYSEDSTGLLKKILKAITPVDVEQHQYVLIRKQTPAFREVQEQFPEIQRWLIFGYTPVQLGCQCVYRGGIQHMRLMEKDILFIPSLTELSNSESLKKELWKTMKKVFQLS